MTYAYTESWIERAKSYDYFDIKYCKKYKSVGINYF